MELPVVKVGRALFARLLFAIHGLIVIWRVASIYHDKTYWLFAIFLIAIFVEGGLVIYQRHGNETTWFCLSVFLYLCSVVPPIWFLQLKVCRKAFEKTLERNFTIFETDKEIAIFEFVHDYKLSVYIPIKQELWVQLLQQTMLVILILGRWILPKGDISRDHLSQILLVFLAMAADMVELFDTFKENQVISNIRLTELVLAVWSVSLIQFPLVLTGRSAKKARLGYMKKYFRASVHYARRSLLYKVKEPPPSKFFFFLITNDVNFWAVITGIILQDAPFLVIRLYLLFVHNTISYIMIFFTCKNVLVVMLQTYRLYVIAVETYKKVMKAKQAFGTGKTVTPDGKVVDDERCKSAPITPPVQQAKQHRKLYASKSVASIPIRYKRGSDLERISLEKRGSDSSVCFTNQDDKQVDNLHKNGKVMNGKVHPNHCDDDDLNGSVSSIPIRIKRDFNVERMGLDKKDFEDLECFITQDDKLMTNVQKNETVLNGGISKCHNVENDNNSDDGYNIDEITD